MSKRVTEVPDFQLDNPHRVLMSEHGIQILPTPLVFAQAEFAMSIRVSHENAIIAAGSIKSPCFDCQRLCWRSPSTPKRLRMLCTECGLKRIKGAKSCIRN